MRLLIILGFFLLAHSLAISQEVVMKNYCNEDGLPSNQAFHVMQDSKGYIWIGTDKGVSRFDGYEFKNFGTKEGLGGPTILDIYEDFKGRIWFIPLNARLSYYEKDSIYKYKHNDSLTKYLPKSPVALKRSFFVDSSNSVYISVRPSGIFKMDSAGRVKHWETWPTHNNYIHDFGNLAITSNLYRNVDYFNIIKNDKYTFSIEKPDLFNPKRGLSLINKIVENQYYISNTRSVFFLSGKDSKEVYKNNHFIIEFIVGKNDKPWIGLEKGGVKQFNNLSFRRETKQLLDDKSVSTVLMDNDGGYWFTTLENGVYYSSDLNTVSLSNKQLGKNTNIKRIVKYDNKLLAIEKNGVIFEISLNKETKKYDIKKNVLKLSESDFLDEIEVADNKVLVGSNLSFLIKDVSSASFKKQILRLKKANIPTKGIKSMCVTNSGQIYLGGAIGFFEWESRNKNEIIVDQKTKIRTSCITETADKKGLWIGSLYGLYKYIKSDDTLIYYGEVNSKLKSRVLDIKLLPNHKIAIATKGDGIQIYNIRNNTIRSVTKAKGLTSDFINTLAIDSNSVIWAGTSEGMNKITLSDTTIPVQQIDKSNGIVSNHINDIKIFDSSLFISTDKGISIYDKDNKKKTNEKLRVHIDEVSVSKTSDGNYLVNHPNNTISFKFTPLVYYHSKDLLYRYRISGLSGEWQYTTNNSVFYPFIPEGQYYFEISVKDKNGFWGEITRVPFIIETPYWNTTWFLVFIITVLIIIVSAIILLIITNRRIKEKARQEIIKYQQKALSNQMNPHFLFNSLNSIHRYLLENNSIFASKYLSKFARLMRLFLNNSEKETIVISKEVESIKLYLELENLRMKNAFEFNVHIDKNIDAYNIHVPTMLLQPIVENSVIHGIRYLKNSVGLIELSFLKEDNSLKIILTDNGVGRDKASEIEHKNNHKSHGGSIVRKRIKLLNQLYQANIAIIYLDLHGEDSQNKGTKVIIKNIPIKLRKNDKSINH